MNDSVENIKMTIEFTTSHKLDFEVAPWEYNVDPENPFFRFRVGTCEGLWGADSDGYSILAVTNSAPNNGHFEDVLQWFEHSCKRDKKDLWILEVWNQKLKKHLIEKRGFMERGMDNVVKPFTRINVLTLKPKNDAEN